VLKPSVAIAARTPGICLLLPLQLSVLLRCLKTLARPVNHAAVTDGRKQTKLRLERYLDGHNLLTNQCCRQTARL
jgi:hypothetical protein